eukprot:3960845-Pleurochrysis_carterae.AAC.1
MPCGWCVSPFRAHAAARAIVLRARGRACACVRARTCASVCWATGSTPVPVRRPVRVLVRVLVRMPGPRPVHTRAHERARVRASVCRVYVCVRASERVQAGAEADGGAAIEAERQSTEQTPFQWLHVNM